SRLRRFVQTNVLDFLAQGDTGHQGARCIAQSCASPGRLSWGEGDGAFAPTRGSQASDGTSPRAYGSDLGVDGYGGAFAEAGGHRVGKAMAAEPTPTAGRLLYDAQPA